MTKGWRVTIELTGAGAPPETGALIRATQVATAAIEATVPVDAATVHAVDVIYELAEEDE